MGAKKSLSNAFRPLTSHRLCFILLISNKERKNWICDFSKDWNKFSRIGIVSNFIFIVLKTNSIASLS